MRYAPTPSELVLLQSLSASERVEYTLPRLVEAEEVWSIGNENGWLIRDVDGSDVITLWPYRQLAQEYVERQQPGSLPQSVSLEQFLNSVLKQCIQHGITLEICPNGDDAGELMAAGRLHEVLDGMVESGSYFLEG